MTQALAAWLILVATSPTATAGATPTAAPGPTPTPAVSAKPVAPRLISTPPPPAALACANPRLPPSILDGPATQRSTQPPLPAIDVRAPAATLHLAAVADESARELGLMCVTRLRPHAGMIFVYGEDADWEFWMKRTLISLDMLWVASNGRVNAIVPNVPLSTLTTSDLAVARRHGHGRYVIELAAGEARRAKIRIGTMLPLTHVILPTPAD